MTTLASRRPTLPLRRAGREPDAGAAPRRLPVPAAVAGGLVVAAGGILVSVTVGPADLTDAEIVQAVWTRLTVGLDPLSLPERLVTESRVPRTLLAAVVGAVLALVGCILQALVRNPLADPSILGGTAGASLGAVAVIVLGADAVVGLPVGAFLGAAGGFGLALLLAWSGTGLSPLRLILAGVAVSYLLSAVASLIIARADDRELRSAMFWQLGSVAGARWSDLWWPTLLMIAGCCLLLLRARRLDVLAFGDLTATSLGVAPNRLRAELFVVTSLLTGVAVALAGGVGFVALVVPHIVRMLTGPRHASLAPLSVLFGAGFLVWADVAARTLAAPSDLPLGVVTALVGAPVFAVLVTRRMRGEHG